jgi:hypothetical protein
MRFELTAVVLHEIPARARRADLRRGTATDTTPFLTNQLTDLTPDFRAYLENKLVVALGAQAFPVAFSEGAASEVPNLVLTLLGPNHTVPAADSSLIDISQQMAKILHQCQTALSPEGVLAVARGKLRDEPLVAILKLEREEGLRLEREQRGADSIIRAIVERDLVLTQNTRVFKTGFFVKASVDDSIAGWVADNQTGFGGAGLIAANFFLSNFLGCHLLDLPEVETKKLFDASEHWIANSVSDPIEQSKYTRALMAELASNDARFSPAEFATRHLPLERRQAYVTALSQAGAPTATFVKETSLIKNRLREVRMQFKSGISVDVAEKHFEDGVATLSPDEDDATLTKLIIRDVLQGVRGA